MIVREFINLIGFKVDESSLRKGERAVQRLTDKLDTFGKNMTAAITLPFTVLAGFSLKAASDAQEVQNAFNQVFGNLAGEANQFAENLANSLDRVDTSFKDALTSLQSFTVGMGFTRQESLNMSKELLQLGLDLSSFRNIPFDEVMQRFRSGLSGSSEALDQFGINLKAAAIETKATELGIKGSVNQMTEMQKVLIRLSIIRDTLGRQGAIGDAARTSGEFANRLRSATDQVKALAIEIGQVLLPTANRFLGIFIDISKAIQSINPQFLEFLVFLGGSIAAIGPLSFGMSALIKIVGFLSIKLVALAAVLTAISAGIGLVIDDVVKFVKGGKSVLGQFLPPWEQLQRRIVAFFDVSRRKFRDFLAGVERIRDSLEIIFDSIRFGDTELLEAGIAELEEALGVSVERLIETLIVTLEKLTPKIIAVLEKLGPPLAEFGFKLGLAIAKGIGSGLIKGLGPTASKLGLALPKKIGQDIANFGTAVGSLAQRNFNFLTSGGLGRSANNRTTNTNVNTTVNLEVPRDTTENQIRVLEDAAKRTFSNEAKNLQLAFPEVE
jgi:hypothetical protein